VLRVPSPQDSCLAHDAALAHRHGAQSRAATAALRSDQAGGDLNIHTAVRYRIGVWWVREWVYEPRWARGHNGVLSRGVDSPAKLRAVVDWARRNPHIEKCSYRISYRTEGPPIERCPSGHSLLSPVAWQPYRLEQKMRLVDCIDCPGHYVKECPECHAHVFDPPTGPDCGPRSDCTL
jgi:hypothetical protein